MPEKLSWFDAVAVAFLISVGWQVIEIRSDVEHMRVELAEHALQSMCLTIWQTERQIPEPCLDVFGTGEPV